MSAPKKGCHVLIEAGAVGAVKKLYPWVSAEVAYVVAAVDTKHTKGRSVVHVHEKGMPSKRFTLWSTDVKALPRCKWCDVESHSSTYCPHMKKEGARK